jgi:parallel beta-helix repeat protein
MSPYYFVNVGQSVYFDASSSSVAWNGTFTTSIIEYLWNFGDGNVTSSATSNTTHTYLSPGFFKVTLTVFDDVGSNASYSQIARALVNAPGDAWITLSPSSLNVHPGDDFTITVSASNVDLMDAWQVFLKYNLTVVKVTDLWVPSDNVFGDSDVIEQRPEYGREWFTYGMNYVSFRNALDVGNVSVTEGTLFKANCTAQSEGSTSIQIATKNNPVDISMNDYVGLYSTLLLYDELSQSGREIVQPVRAQNTVLIVSNTVFIRGDGSIDPTTAPMKRDGDVYTLTGNITSDADGIVVERDNVVVDGSGYTVEGAGAFTSSLYGVYLDGRSNVTIQNTNIKNFNYGIWLNSSSNNSINQSNVANNWCGILLRYSSNNSMNGNTIADNKEGIWLAHSSNGNSIEGNNVTDNMYEGILLDSSSNNIIYHNNFVNNTRQVYYIVAPVANVWDDGYPSGGNYWSDYDGTDADYDGIGDTPYVIDEKNIDAYPLMVQYVIPEFPSFLTLPLIFAATSLVVIVCKRKHR